MTSQLNSLTEINLDDLVASFGWQENPLPAALVRRLFVHPARKFAGQMVEYDTLVGRMGLHEASSQVLHGHYIRELCVHGQQNIPADGPLLFLSNHPGMTDTVSLFAAIPHSNLRIIATHRPFLLSLPNISQHLSYISDDPGDRMHAVRQVSTHLRSGGAALTFPAGEIEPDPDVHTGAEELVEALDRLFRRLHAFRTRPADRPHPGKRRNLGAYRAPLADAPQAHS